MRIETKLSIGDWVYWMQDNKIEWGIIRDISVFIQSSATDIKYTVDFAPSVLDEDKIFATKQHLLNSL